MSNESPQPNSGPPSTEPSAPPSSAPGGSPPEFRFGDDAPEWAKGKTAGEVLNLAKTMEQALKTAMPQQFAPPAQPAPQAQPQSRPTTDDWLVQPDVATQRIAEGVFAERFAPAIANLQSVAAQFAQTQRYLAETKWATEFARYGPEIDTLMANVAPEQRTLENYGKVVTFVRGNHFDELAAEKAQKLSAQGGLGERSGGGGFTGTPQGGVDLNKLPHGVGEIARQKGVTEQMVRDYCRATNTTPEEWMRQMLDDKIVTSTAPFTFEVNEKTLGVNRGFNA